MSAYQFDYLIRLGLQEQHTLLDIGCGSLGGGRLFIPYLLPGRYHGMDPLVWLIEDALKHELGSDILEAKEPVFLIDDNFTCSAFGRTFDFVLAHSLFSHASLQQIRRCLSEVRTCMTPSSIFAATYLPGETDYEGEDGLYPDRSTYRIERIADLAAEHGLVAVEHEPHLHGQQWVLFTLATRPGDGDRRSPILPRVEAVFCNPPEAAVGEVVRVGVSAVSYGGDLATVQLCVNSAADGTTAGDWKIVGTQTVSGRLASVVFAWDTTCMPPGKHRLGVNVTRSDGERLRWHQQQARVYRLTAASDESRRPPEPRVQIRIARPPEPPTAGGVVDIGVLVETRGERLALMQLVVNHAPDGSADGEWMMLETHRVSGAAAAAAFAWDTRGFGPGEYRIGVNVTFENGEKLWWYDHPALTYVLG